MTADAVGGVWQYVIDLANGLRPHGVEVTLAVLGPMPSLVQEATAARAGITLLATGLPLDWTAGRPSDFEETAWEVARLAIDAMPDVIQLNQPALAADVTFPAPVVAVCHSCLATWWKANRSGPLPADFAWRTDMVSRGYRAADALVAPSAAFALETAGAYDLPDPPLVVRNGRRVASLSPSDRQRAAFTAGRLWDEGKNVATLDRAAARLSFPVLAAGPLDGPNGAHVDLAHIQGLGPLADADVAAHLAARPIFVSAARYEPFGLAVLEAAQAGCALVLSDIPTFRELWRDAAVFVPPDDDAAIARAIQRLVDDDEERDGFETAARERSSAYTVEAMSLAMLAIYRSLVADRVDSSFAEGAAA
jgi:glycosyltransferase involved in cell wall biosynthesis